MLPHARSGLPTRGVAVALLIGLAALALIPRFAAARHRFWADEIFSVAIATGHSLEHPASVADVSLGDWIEWSEPRSAADYRAYMEHTGNGLSARAVLRAVFLSDTSPPLYYLALHAWTLGTGTSDTAVRAFSLLASIACMPLIWSLGLQVGGRATGLLACLLFALAPFAVKYSVEARMYSLVWLEVLACAWLTLAIVREEGKRFHLLPAWVVVSAAGLLTHYFFAFSWAASVLWILLSSDRVGRAWLVMACAATAVLLLPWYVHLPESFSHWRVTAGWLNGPTPWPSGALGPFRLAWQMVSRAEDQATWGRPLVAGGLALALLGAVRFRATFRHTGTPFLWLWLGGACCGPLVFDLVFGTRTSAVSRYASPGLPAALILLSDALARMPARERLFPLLLIFLGWFHPVTAFALSQARSDGQFAAIASRFESWKKPDDLLIVYSIPSGVLGVARYLEDGPALLSWVPQLAERDTESLVKATELRRRVGVVTVHAVVSDPPDEHWQFGRWRLVDERWIAGANVREFAPIAPGRDPASFPPAGQDAKSLAASSPPGAFLRGEPTEVAASPSDLRTFTLKWNAGNESGGQVFVSVDGAPAILFAAGHEGTQEAAWIQPTSSYRFTLYGGTRERTQLATLDIAGEAPIAASVQRTLYVYVIAALVAWIASRIGFALCLSVRRRQV